MIIQHNLPSMNSYRQLSVNNKATSKNLEKLSSGFRINRAGDDAAGLAISEKMRGQIRGLQMANSNALNGVALIQTAEGGLNEVHSVLQRIRELAVQSSNGTYHDKVDRESLNKEVQALKNEINRISASTHYNGIGLLNGAMGGIDAKDTTFDGFTAGSEKAILEQLKEMGFKGDTIIIYFLNASSTAELSGQTADLIIEGGDVPQISMQVGDKTYRGVLSVTGGGTFEDVDGEFHSYQPETYVFLNEDGKVAATLQNGNGGWAAFGEALVSNKSSGVVAGITLGGIPGTTGSGATILIWDPPQNTKIEEGHPLYNAVIATENSKMIFQIGANGSADQRLRLHVGNMSAASLGVQGGKKLHDINVKTHPEANEAIEVIDAAINQVSGTRADLGSLQNRLEHTINNLGVAAENLQAAESLIRDVNMAKEMMEFTKNNILSQAAQSMLAQANQLPQSVLRLFS